MPVDPQFVGLLQILLGVVSLFFLKPAYDNRDRAGSWSFAVLCVGIGVYGLSAGLDWFVSGYALSHFVFTFRSLGGVLITTAWLLLALSVTDRLPVTRRHGAAFASYVVATQLFFWTDPLHHFVVAPGSTMNGANFDPTIGVGLWAILGVGYLATFVGTGLLAADALRSTGIRRRQRLVLSLAIVPTLLGSLATVSGVTVYDYTPLGYALTATMFAWALFSGRFLDLTPVARRTALGEMSDAVVTLDDGNRVVDCNRRARELFDADDDYTGKSAADFFPSVVGELDSFDDVETETEIQIRPDDRDRHFSLSVSPVTRRGHSGRVVVLRDITDRKRREQELERQNERLDRFASMVGHDLRNPLTVAAGQLALAEAKCESDVVREHVEAVERSHERMDAMVEDLLTLARSGQRVEETEPVEMAALAREAWTHAEVEGCELDMAVPDDVTIAADHDRLLHVFENCFRNAAEHGSAGNQNAARSDDAAEHGSANPDSQARQDAADHNDGSVTVRVGLLGETGDGLLGFFIEDDGEGIPAADRDRVFDHGYTTGEAGTGLGLFIVKDIVDAHGWDVRVTEGTDGGARFEVTGVEPGDG
ncbi:PAS domain-containing protein [Halomicroarcula sp. F28]|uniref:histidine kinase N-terminal 7TM domain-containing protein n=1 Tax=Haloarcula salinisoli TaxID=2487746 RepID=UPI001C738AFE|nr:histidine kinase N-terminal 7TM domain-containing protein [Halomicroarcula salinisoli]MBX0286027.1 PAS domain-containing protein [Halomicroarcula salinisoli]